MICPYCGVPLDPSFKFCYNCGAKVPAQAVQQNPYPNMPQQNLYQPSLQQNPYQQVYPVNQQLSQQSASKRKFNFKMPKFADKFRNFDVKKFFSRIPRKVFLIGGAALAAVVVLLSVLAVVLGGNSDFMPKDVNQFYYYDADTGEASFFRDHKLIEEGLEVDIELSSQSMDGSVMAFLTDENEVYVVRDGEVAHVAEEVEKYYLSLDGSTLACIDEDDVLSVYSTGKLKAETVAEDVYCAVLSPNGKNLVYTCVEKNDKQTMYLYNGKESTELGRNYVPFAVSNNSKLIYCYHTEREALYVMNAKGEETKLAADLDTDSPVTMNADHTDIFFCADGKWFVSEKGGDKVKVNSKDSYFYLLDGAFSAYSYSSIASGFGVETAAVKDFGGHFYMGGSTLYFLDKSFSLEKIVNDVEYSSVYITADGTRAFYLRDSGSLCCVSAGDITDETQLAEDVDAYAITPDGSAVYYRDQDDTLYYQKGTGEAKRLADDVYSFYVTHDSYCLFMTDYKNSSGTVYASRNGSKREQLFSEGYRIVTYANVTCVLTDYNSKDNTYSIHTAPKGIKFVCVMEN